MSRISRFTPEEKVEIVERYLTGKIGRGSIISTYGIGYTTLRDWVRLYKMRGAHGLVTPIHNRKYTPEIKLNAVVGYINGEGSISETCRKYNITDTSTLRLWIKLYNNHGRFHQPNSGGVVYMVKSRKTNIEERIEIVSHCISNNKDYGGTVNQYNVSYQQVYAWVGKYEKNGLNGLVDRRGKRKDEVAMTEMEKLRAELKFKEAENFRLQVENDLLKKLEEIERGRD